jgi:uncharacterized membrane-anchored protein YhcB (DUF1043 family)
MTDQNLRSNFGVLLLVSVGAGALTGIAIGLLAVRRPQAQAQEEISETVDDLKRRAELILSELSRNHTRDTEAENDDPSF